MRLYRAAAVGSGVAVLAAMLIAPPVATASSEGDLVLVATRHSLLGTHSWYRQTYKGLPVVDGYYARHTDKSGHVTVDDGRLPVPTSLPVSASVSESSAEGTAQRRLGATALRQAAGGKNRTTLAATTRTDGRLAVVGGADARLVWQVVSTGREGSTESVVDARTGALVSQRSLVKNETGQGTVFSPNPVVALRDEGLLDKHDSDQAVLGPAYKTLQLTNLDDSGRLKGAFARVMNQNVATSVDGDFRYTRHDNRFEQVSAYYNVTKAQKYLQRLGFTDVNNEAQKMRTNSIPDDNSFYDPAVDQITFGRGGVDDAEDQEVVWHELGHAIQDAQVPDFGASLEAGAIGEGFGDYWAVTMSQPVSGGFDLPCVMDWDATAYTPGPSHCLRRTDTDKTTDDIEGEVHDDGEIWSRALWDIHRAVGRRSADTLIIESQFGYSPDTSLAKAARVVVSTARALYGDATASQVRGAFVARRILG